MFNAKPALIISGMVILPDPKTIALGGVATGGGYATTKTQRQQIYGMLTPEKDQMELMQIDGFKFQ